VASQGLERGAHQVGRQLVVVLRRAAGQRRQLAVERQLGRRHRVVGGAVQARIDQRHTEGLDAEAAAGQPLLAALQGHVVRAQRRGGGHGPAALGGAAVLPGGGRQRQPRHRVATDVRDDHFGGQLGGGHARQAALGLNAHEVLHAQRLARAPQRAAEHGVGAAVGHGALRGVDAKAPGLDAAVPAAEHQAQFGLAVERGARGDEEAVAAQAAGRARLGCGVCFAIVVLVVGLVEAARDARQPLRVGAATPQRLAPAVVHGHGRARHRAGAVERRHPHEAGAAPALEVHAQVGDERGGARVLRLGWRQQRLAEQLRFGLDDVQAAGGQRHADHLGGAQRVRARRRQRLAARGGFARGQRLLAAAVLIGLVALQPRGPFQQRGVGRGRAEMQRAQRALRPAAGQIGLDVAQRHRQQRRAGLAGRGRFDHGKGRCRKAHQRRQRAGVHFERKTRGVGQRATGGVHHLRWQGQRVARVLGQRGVEGQAGDERAFVVEPRQPRRQRPAPAARPAPAPAAPAR
jgi:hypothetical protein